MRVFIHGILFGLMIYLLAFLALSFINLVPNYFHNKNIELLTQEIKSFEVVIARYNEDLSWISKEFTDEKITIYNKGKDDLNLPSHYKIVKLPNVGRESHTYLYHILSNYDNLANRTLFLQGDPYDSQHSKYEFFPFKTYKKIAKTACDNIIANNCFVTNVFLIESNLDKLSGKPRAITTYGDYNFIDFRNKFVHKKPFYQIFLTISYGANFAVDKEKIRNNSKDYYQNIFNTLNSLSPIEGFYIEHLWNEMFQSS